MMRAMYIKTNKSNSINLNRSKIKCNQTFNNKKVRLAGRMKVEFMKTNKLHKIMNI